MFGHHVGDPVAYRDFVTGQYIFGMIIAIPKVPSGLFKVAWCNNSTSLLPLDEIREVKYTLEDRVGIGKSG